MPEIVKLARQNPHRLVALIGLLVLFSIIPLTGVIVYKTISLRGTQSRAATANIDISASAVQKVHVNAVPQTDTSGNFKNDYGANSLLPLGIYNPTLCQVTKTLSWASVSGYSGEYKIKVNYGPTRDVGTYTIADINTGTGFNNQVVGNLPPSTVLHYSVWRVDNGALLTEGTFTSDACTNAAEDTNLDSIKNAGFNLAILEKNVYPDNNYLNRAGQSGVRLLLDMRDRPSNTFTSLKDNPNVFGFYISDDDLAKAKFYNTDSDSTNNVDVNAIFGDLKSYHDSLRSQTTKTIIGAEPDFDINDSNNNSWQDWFNKFDGLGNISFHYNYPKSSSGFSPWVSIKSVADTVSHQVQINGDNRPSWFIDQAINLKWVIPLLFPTPAEERAMKYAAIVHGATGIFDFSYDGWFRRQPKGTPNASQAGDINWWDRHAGIKSNTPTSYPGGDRWAYSVSDSEKAESTTLWNGISAANRGINKELQQLAPVILSKTSPDDYKVYVDSQPKTQTPIRTILKNYMGRTYLIAVNIDNAPVTAKFSLTGKSFERATVMFENRNATLSNGNEITELFNPFDVNVYRLDPTPPSTLGTSVQSSRQVCNLLGSEQALAGIYGQDGGTSLKIGNDSFWTFGDTTNSSGFPFIGNNIAKTQDTDLGDCASLTPKKNGALAQELLSKLSDEFLVWPDGMANVASGIGHFFYMSVRNCQQPETCSNNLFSPDNGSASWKVRGIGLAKFDTSSMNSQRVGNCSPVVNCLFWRENDGSGINVAGATAAVDGNYVYVYLNESPDGVFQNGVRVARVDKSQIENKAAYQYWDGANWISSFGSSARIIDIPSGFNGVSVAKNNFLGKWTAVYTSNNFNSVMMQTADNPWGPWGNEQLLFDCRSAFGADSTFRCYFGRQHEEFQKNNGQTVYVSYVNQNTYKVYINEVQFKTALLPNDSYLAQYFDNADFTNKVLERNEPAAKLTGGRAGAVPVSELTPDGTFSIRWEGNINFSGNRVRFNTNPASSKVKVFLDGNLINDGTLQQNGIATPSAGRHVVRYDYVKDDPTKTYSLMSNIVETLNCFDLTGDSVINAGDQAVQSNHYNAHGDTPWDLNLDRVVNGGDSALMSNRYGKTCPHDPAPPLPTSTPTPTATPVANASCTLDKSSVIRGNTVAVNTQNIPISGFPIILIGVFNSPVYTIGNLDTASKEVLISTNVQLGLYKIQIQTQTQGLIVCAPDLAVN